MADQLRYTVQIVLKQLIRDGTVMLSSFATEFAFTVQPNVSDVVGVLIIKRNRDPDTERKRAYTFMIEGVQDGGVPPFPAGEDFVERTFGLDERNMGVTPSGLFQISRIRFIDNSS